MNLMIKNIPVKVMFWRLCQCLKRHSSVICDAKKLYNNKILPFWAVGFACCQCSVEWDGEGKYDGSAGNTYISNVSRSMDTTHILNSGA
jgi:hypothetical protein